MRKLLARVFTYSLDGVADSEEGTGTWSSAAAYGTPTSRSLTRWPSCAADLGRSISASSPATSPSSGMRHGSGELARPRPATTHLSGQSLHTV